MPSPCVSERYKNICCNLQQSNKFISIINLKKIKMKEKYVDIESVFR